MQQLGKDFEPGPLEPVLKSLMDEDDPEVRFIACGAVQEVCAIVEGSLGNEQVRNLYIELLKPPPPPVLSGHVSSLLPY
jgi:hypothetical protein